MDALLDEDEALLQETAHRVVSSLVPASVRDLETFDPARGWRALHDLGLVGIRVPEACGGGGGSTLDASIVVGAVAQGALPVPYLGSLLATELLLAAGAPADTLAQVADGGIRLSIGLSEDLSVLGGCCATDGDAIVGFDAAGADALVVLDPNSRAVRALSAGTVAPGLDLTRTVSRARLDATTDLGGLGDPVSEEAFDRFLARALAYLSADLVGVMSAALQSAVDHATSRIQFGAPIGIRQALQHLAADQLVSLEGARSLAEYAAWAADQDDVTRALEAAREAKAYCSRAARSLCEAVVQIYGGMGFTWECMAHVYLKRALIDGRVFGDYDHHVELLARTRQEALR